MAKLTEKQKRFADEYIISLNATQAAIKAGYSKKYANTNASKLLHNTTIKQHIDEQLAKISSEKVADAQEVMEYLTSVMRGKSISEIVVVEGEGEGCSRARRMDKAPDEKEKLKAAELLGKRLGMWKDKIEVSGMDEEKSKLSDLLKQMSGDG